MKSYHIIGIMSGTSLDGLDLTLCSFEFDKKWKFEIKKTNTIPYSHEWYHNLTNADKLSGIDLLKLNKSFGQYIGESVLAFIKDIDEKIDLIASHGHTVFHQPSKKITLQIGDGNEILATTGITTISDFRSLDVALGGQGAPLVPIGDELLFPEFDYCINLGGFANISFKNNNTRLAYDIGPANIVLNFLAQKLKQPFDKDGQLGKTGIIDPTLLNKLNTLEYYQLPHPKSLGKEWLQEEFLPILKQSKVDIKDLLRTVYEHIAVQISAAIKNHPNSKSLITGGGACNNFLVELIKEKTNSEIIIPDRKTIEYKEALIFAFLGLLRYTNQINCLASVTGAKRDSCGGIIHEHF